MGEIYSGVKFTSQLSKKEITYPSEIETLKFWCSFYSIHNLAPKHETGSFGNLSIRTNNGIFITATGIDLGNINDSNSFVKLTDCDFDKMIITAEGLLNPSSESMLHFYIYSKRPEIKAIFHGHNIEICNIAIENNNIRETETEEPYGTIKLVESTIPFIEDDIFIMKNHGFIISGTTIRDAGILTKKLLSM